jgi:hypothetical protein
VQCEAPEQVAAEQAGEPDVVGRAADLAQLERRCGDRGHAVTLAAGERAQTR